MATEPTALPSETTLAYLAGVIDSDGYISIQQSAHRGTAYFGARIGISGTRTEPHQLAASIWGGNINSYTPKNPRHRVQYQWARHGAKALGPIYDVLPYLLIKREQALLAIEAQEHVLYGSGPDPYPWMLFSYDPEPYLTELRNEVVLVLNQNRRNPKPQLDGRTWDEMPEVRVGTP